jgi:hypothetical protein
MRRTTWILIILIIFTAGLSVYKTMHVAVDLFMENKTHSIECRDLPTIEHVQKVLRSHKDLVDKIMKINPGHIHVVAGNSRCKTRADIVIVVSTSKNSHKLRYLFGIPYRILNQ